MIVIFDPQPPLMRWYKLTDKGTIVEECRYKNAWEQEVSIDLKDITHIAYVLYNGGDAISESVVTINSDMIATVEKCVPLLPERNQMTLEAIRYWYKKVPAIRHTLFCETALYTKLPPKARNYAIPAELREKGAKRYGGYGLQHAYMLDKIKPVLNGSAGKIVSIFVGPETNVTAFYEGKPLETSIGFSPAEGIPSLHGSGDTDASLVFLMQENGYGLDDIASAFSKKGGQIGRAHV
jgi:acetate kinase